ncbi:MAG TPA: glucose-6-phosphate dehydrogenase [Gammaproteobacteria bacterium]|jgi:glucose-6-phosphate 1-dehydrogenase
MSQRPASDALVLFGATGDLANKMLYPALQALVKREHFDMPVIGVSRSEWDDEHLREYAHQSLEQHHVVDKPAFEKLASMLHYVPGDYRDPATFTKLQKALNGAKHPLYYLAIPPSTYSDVVKGLGQIEATRGARVVAEKPFGRDLASARALNHTLHGLFDEDAILRIDHYLGKETVLNLPYFRFANSFIEPIWNRNQIRSVQITMAESFGIGTRGKLYESLGAIRDVVQNHMLQVVAMLAMEPPQGEHGEAFRDEKVKVFKSIRPLTAEDVVRGQYQGYRQEADVAPDSDTETFAALRLHLDSWRWAGVPFFIRAGKRMAATATEVMVELKRPPQKVFAERRPKHANHVRFQLGPDRMAIGIGIRAKRPGPAMVGEDMELFVCDQKHEGLSAYERLIGDAIHGDVSQFDREDGVEQAWRIVEPILKDPTPVRAYAAGSWGPAEADALTARYGGWHVPRVKS